MGLENYLITFKEQFMKKIMSLFQRNYEGDRKVRDEVTPGAEWVVQGEGYATRKWDGVAVLVKDGQVFKRYDAKTGRTPPIDFIPAQPNPDPKSGHWPGWVPAEGPESKYIREAVEWAQKNKFAGGIPDGTYEACGPKIGTRHGANPEGLTEHILVPHGKDILEDCPRTFDGIKEWLRDKPIEGIVWHHEDGRLVKIKKADFPY
jgi:hypothetical protein